MRPEPRINERSISETCFSFSMLYHTGLKAPRFPFSIELLLPPSVECSVLPLLGRAPAPTLGRMLPASPSRSSSGSHSRLNAPRFPFSVELRLPHLDEAPSFPNLIMPLAPVLNQLPKLHLGRFRFYLGGTTF